MSTWGLIPVKGFCEGKSRLAEVLKPVERSRLARDLFLRTAAAFLDCVQIKHVATVTESAEVRQMARRLGMTTLQDKKGKANLGDVIDGALKELTALGATRIVVCMADLPSLTAREIARVASQLDDVDIVIVPDLAQRGTNVLGIRSSALSSTCFGHEDSFARHRVAAQKRGLQVNVHLSPTLGFDVDEPKDLTRFNSIRPTHP